MSTYCVWLMSPPLPSTKQEDPHDCFLSPISGSVFKPEKVKINNDILIDLVSNKIAKKMMVTRSTYLAPSTLNTMIRAFFVATKDQYEWELLSSNFNFDGGYNVFKSI